MADTKIYADGEAITVWWAPLGYAAIPSKPTVAELNAALDITCDVAWDGYSFGTQASNQVSDPSMCDVGNTQTRGFAQFGGSISFFLPDSYFPVDATNDTQNTFYALEESGAIGYLIIRVDGKKTTAGVGDQFKEAVAGDFVAIYKVQSDGYALVNTGEVNFKYTITFQPQGDLWVNAIIGPAPTIAAPAPIGTADLTAGGRTPLSAYFAGRQLSAVAGQTSGYPGWFRWTSDDPAIASVDANGVVTGVAVGTASITAIDKVTGAVSAPYSAVIA